MNPDHADETPIVQALQAVVAGNPGRARDLAIQAAGAGGRLGPALTRHLETDVQAGVYATPAGFEAFIAGGGNIPLYEQTSAALAALYDEHRPHTLLDIGCGNGRALIPALHRSRHQPARFDLVEPSPALLAQVRPQLPAQAEVHTWPGPVQDVLASPSQSGRPRLAQPTPARPVFAQSTFALHTLPPDERTDVLSRLRAHVDVLAIVEFDVPEHVPGSPEHLRLLARTYEQGLAEYEHDEELLDLVAQGFLMPVLVGQLRPGAQRVTWEQNSGRWRQQVSSAGYRDVEVRRLHDYWSAPAFLLTARSAPNGAA